MDRLQLYTPPCTEYELFCHQLLFPISWLRGSESAVCDGQIIIYSEPSTRTGAARLRGDIYTKYKYL